MKPKFAVLVMTAFSFSTGITGLIRAEGDSWPQFRGPGAQAVSDNPGLPGKWSANEGIEWSVEVPGLGWSSPVVVNGKVFLTSTTSEKEMKQPSLGVDFSNEYVAELTKQGKTEAEAEELVIARDMELPEEIQVTYNLFCLDLASGKILWKNEFFNGAPPVGRHRKNSYTSETPVTDGEAVYVYVASQGVYAFDMEGKQLWSTPLESRKVYLDFGTGASPALHGDRLFILNDNEEESFIAGFDTKTGKQLWYTARPGLGSKMIKSGWSTPFVWENEVRTEVVTVGPGMVISYDLDGKELWRMKRIALSAIQSPFARDGLLYVVSGGSSGQTRPIVAIRPGGSGDITPPEDQNQGEFVAWYNRTGGGTYLPTPVIYGGGMYVLTDKGILSRYDAKSGKRTYQSRIHPRAVNFTASPWAYNGMIFCINEEGTTFVIKAGEEFELLGMNELDGFTQASPAMAGDRLLIRTQHKLYSIRNGG